MNLHQVLTGAVNPGDHCFSVGSVGDQRFTVSGEAPSRPSRVRAPESAGLGPEQRAEAQKPVAPAGSPTSQGGPHSLGSADLAFENGGGNSTWVIELLNVYRDYTRKLECFVGFFQALI